MSHRPKLSDILKADFEKNKKKNQSFSVRAYARMLNLSPSTLHALLYKKAAATDATLSKIRTKLRLSLHDLEYFRSQSKLQRARTPEGKESLSRRLAKSEPRFGLLTEDDFKTLSSWYFHVLKELMSTRSFRNDPEWISRAIGITSDQADEAIQALTKLGIVQKDSRGEYRVNQEFIALPSGPPLQEAKNVHLQFMERAQRAVLDQPKGTRNFSTLVLKFRKSDLGKVDEKIRIFRREFSQEFESGGEHDSVYTLAVQFFRNDVETS